MMGTIESIVMASFHDSDKSKPNSKKRTILKTQLSAFVGEKSLPFDMTKQLTALKEFILQAPEVNYSKIQLLKEEIASGRYHIANNQIAAKMVGALKPVS